MKCYLIQAGLAVGILAAMWGDNWWLELYKHHPSTFTSNHSAGSLVSSSNLGFRERQPRILALVEDGEKREDGGDSTYASSEGGDSFGSPKTPRQVWCGLILVMVGFSSAFPVSEINNRLAYRFCSVLIACLAGIGVCLIDGIIRW